MTRAIPWDDVFGWMLETSEGPTEAATRFELPRGSVLSGVQRERAKPGHGRLAGHPLCAETAEVVEAGRVAAVMVPTESLRPWVRNPRHNDPVVERLIASIREFGFGAPIVARREDGEVIAGHTRLKAALKMGLPEVPVRYMDLTAEQAHRLALADNKIAEFAEWDDAALRAFLAEGVDLASVGWTEHELEDLGGATHPRPMKSLGGKAGAGAANPARRVMVQLHVAVQEVEVVEGAIDVALRRVATRGEALALICREWADGNR